MANTTGKKFGGRKKGTPNKLSATVKDNVIAVFDQLGGVENMVTWAKENPTQFYNIYSKLMPTEVQADVNHNGVIAVGELDVSKLNDEQLRTLASIPVNAE